jgi:NAD(P)-dependent dehydrogenase (short-subunit alcohol dehydrogenase family)
MNVILVLAWLERCVALTVLITGGNGGIGSELAIKFAAAGHDVIVACRGRSAHVHERIVEERLESRARIVLGLDVLDDAKVDAFFDSLKAEGVVLDILVNAAGARARRPPLVRSSPRARPRGDRRFVGRDVAAGDGDVPGSDGAHAARRPRPQTRGTGLRNQRRRANPRDPGGPEP